MSEKTIEEHNEEIIRERKIARINELLSKKGLTPLEDSELAELQGFVETTISDAKQAAKSYFEPLSILLEKIKEKLKK